MPELAEMASVEPESRASAAQMLVKHFDGRGLTTPRDKVTPREEASTGNPTVAIKAQRGRPMDWSVP